MQKNREKIMQRKNHMSQRFPLFGNVLTYTKL